MARSMFSPVLPLYRQLAERIQSDIIDTSADHSRPIPSELELMERYGVSRVTVRKAVEDLVKEGRLMKIQGKGTFITQPLAYYPFGHGDGFTKSCQMRGVVPSTRLLGMEETTPSDEDRAFLETPEGEKVLKIQRLRCGNGQPQILETVFYPMKYAMLRREELEGSLYALLKEKYGIQPVKGHKWIEICHISAYEAQILNSSAGTAMIAMHEFVTNQRGEPLHTSQLIITPNYRFYM